MKQFILLAFLLIFISACSDKEKPEDPTESQIVTDSEIAEQITDEPKRPEQTFSEMLKAQTQDRDLVIHADDIVLGDPEAKVVVIEYFAMTCPHCHGFLKRTFPEIKRKYIDTKKIAYVLREFVGNKQDLYASTLARCQGTQESFLNFMEVLLSRQSNWAFNRKFEEVLTNIAALGGVSAEEYTACLANEQLSKTFIENTKVPLKFPSFVGTPTFFINGVHFTKPYTLQELSSAIDKALKESQTNAPDKNKD